MKKKQKKPYVAESAQTFCYRLAAAHTEKRAYGRGGAQGISFSCDSLTPERAEDRAPGALLLTEAGAGRIAEFVRTIAEDTEKDFRAFAKESGENLALSVRFEILAGQRKNRLILRRTLTLARYAKPSLSGERIAEGKETAEDVFLLPGGFLRR